MVYISYYCVTSYLIQYYSFFFLVSLYVLHQINWFQNNPTLELMYDFIKRYPKNLVFNIRSTNFTQLCEHINEIEMVHSVYKDQTIHVVIWFYDLSIWFKILNHNIKNLIFIQRSRSMSVFERVKTWNL